MPLFVKIALCLLLPLSLALVNDLLFRRLSDIRKRRAASASDGSPDSTGAASVDREDAN